MTSSPHPAPRLVPAFALFLPLFLGTTTTPATAQTSTTEQKRLEGKNGWDVFQVHHSDKGVWYARVDKVVRAFGAPEVIVTDDSGRLTVLSVYSGNWTARSVNPDGAWLAPSCPADVDPRVSDREIYAAGKAGNVHRISIVPGSFGKWALDSVEIGHAAGEEFHTVVAADLLPDQPGDELLAFAISGTVYVLDAGGAGVGNGAEDGSYGTAPDHGFDMRVAARIEGRVRDAVVMPPDPRLANARPWIAGTSRSGHLLRLELDGQRLEHSVLATEPMGLGRVARRPRPASDTAKAEVLYVTRDDGVVLRFEQRDGAWHREIVFVGAQGLRGVVAGRFHQDPSRECLVVYGYGRKVQLVSRAGEGPWEVETIFAGEQRGHWLAAGEFDGRNGTDELIATGFDGQVLLLAREPGYGLPAAIAVDPGLAESEPIDGVAAEVAAQPWRIAIQASAIAVQELSPLNYQGGFETKTMVYETLVRRGADGGIVPGLASSWALSQGGRVFTFTLRAGAKFHDGTPVTAADVVMHFRRWVGLPEHSWLRSNERITAIEAVEGRVRITLDRPHALLPDLCAVNPTAIRAPGALDREGVHRRAIGSGPFRFVGLREDGRVLRYQRFRPEAASEKGSGAAGRELVDLVRVGATGSDDPLDALLRGEVDAVLGSWLVRPDPARSAALREDPRFQVVEGPGSSMVYLGFRLGEGPTADRELRRRVAAAIDRGELIRRIEHGLADPSTGWAAPSVRIWPQGQPVAPVATTAAPLPPLAPLRIAPGLRGGRRLVELVIAQLGRAGLPAKLLEPGEPAWDLRVEVTHGVPYDPFTTAVSRFTPPANPRNAASPRGSERARHPGIAAAMAKALATPDEAERHAVFAEVQRLLDEEAVIVPLYAPRRVAVLRKTMPRPELTHDMYSLDPSWLWPDR